MDIFLLERQGLSQRQIAKRLGISRNTVKKFIESQGFSDRHRSGPRKSQLDPYKDNIEFWLNEDSEYKATWIYDRLCNLGFIGSYEIVKRKVREIKAEKQRVAYMRFETEPGFQAQVDFGEFQVENPDGTIQTLYLFSMILGYSRKIYGEFIDRCDLPSFLDCHIHAFDYFGGVPDEILYDRMRNVYIGKAAGKKKFNSTLLGLPCTMDSSRRWPHPMRPGSKGRSNGRIILSGKASGEAMDLSAEKRPTGIFSDGFKKRKNASTAQPTKWSRFALTGSSPI